MQTHTGFTCTLVAGGGLSHPPVAQPGVGPGLPRRPCQQRIRLLLKRSGSLTREEGRDGTCALALPPAALIPPEGR